MRKSKLIKKIKQEMIKEELELQYLDDDQHSRAYHTGVIDGLGQALFAISPKEATTRAPISIVWFQEEEPATPSVIQRLRERHRERSFEQQESRLFQTMEAD